jgi:putative ATPase
VRGSDPDAALYWLAKMVYAGEDSRFILRRLLILLEFRLKKVKKAE